MKCTLLDYLSLDDFAGQHQLTDLDNDVLSSINIKYISVIEPPVGDFVRKKELVLTTAIGCFEHEDTLFTFVKEIHDQGACALVIATEDPNYHFPSSVIDFGNENIFPIIYIPWNYRFAEVVEKVHFLTSNAQQELIFWENLQNQLLKLYLSNRPLNDVLSFISNTLNASHVFLTDNYEETYLNPDDSVSHYILKIGITHQTYSYLIIEGYDDDEFHIDTYEQYLSTPLNFWFDREQSLSLAKSEMIDEFVWKLANHEPSLEDGTYIKARNLGIRMDCNNICIVGRLCSVKNGQGRNPEKAAKWLEKNIDSVYQILMQFKRKANRQILWSLQKDILFFYFENIPNTTLKNVSEFLDQVEKVLTPLNTSLQYYWGISSFEPETNNYYTSYQEAAVLADICYRENSVRHRYTKKDASCYILLEKSLNDKKTVAFANSILAPLFEYQQKKNIDLFRALETYIITSGNISESARLLFVHRQTFIYQIKKIETLLNMDLNLHEDFFLLELCIKIAKRT